jgi:4-hydroxy-4-methyl-2-oxoglutarate aldolase
MSADRAAAWAYTIRGQMTPLAGKGDPEKMKACQGNAPGDVIVWSGDGEAICYFGELIAVGMQDCGSVGARRSTAISMIPAGSERSDFQRWQVVEWQQNVYLRGATAKWVLVSPADFILADWRAN